MKPLYDIKIMVGLVIVVVALAQVSDTFKQSSVSGAKQSVSLLDQQVLKAPLLKPVSAGLPPAVTTPAVEHALEKAEENIIVLESLD